MLESAPDEICASPYGLGSDPVRTPSTVNALPGSRPGAAPDQTQSASPTAQGRLVARVLVRPMQALPLSKFKPKPA